MAAKAVSTHGQRTCTVEVSPDEGEGGVDAGTELSVSARVSCPHGCDLSGQRVSIRDKDDTEFARAELNELDGETYVTEALVLRAPLEVGEHRYRVVLAAVDEDGITHEETSTEFSFVVTAHTASVNVWGLPSAIAAGESFKFNVGIKCSAACKLADRPLRIFDHEGAQVAEVTLRDDVWPGTSALYYAEVEAQAPRVPGDYQWQVKAPAADSGVPHAAGSSNFTIKVVCAPDHEVTVSAFDGEKQTPIEGAHVLMHPYRAFTDNNGVAKVKVAKGSYRLFVSGFNYIGYENIIDVAGDVTVRAELGVEPEGQDDYR